MSPTENESTSNSPSGPPSASVDLVFDSGLKKISDQILISDSLDSKIGLLLGFVVVSVAEVFGFLLLAAADNKHASPKFTQLIFFLFLINFILVLSATVTGIVGLGMRKFALGFKYDEMVARARYTPYDLKITFLDDLLQSCTQNSISLDQKQRFARVTLILVVATLLVQAIVSILLFVSLMPEGVCNVG